MKTLTDEQEHAVARRREPLALAAGAGSGKTSVLVERFVRAVCEDGHAPERILAITFTERAAGELQERVRARLLALGEPDAARASERGYVGTFHGFCARVLREHAREAGLEQGRFQILDEALAGRLRRQAFAAALGDFLEGERGDAVDLIAAYGADRARATVLGVFAALRSRGQLTPRLPRPALGDGPDKPDGPREPDKLGGPGGPEAMDGEDEREGSDGSDLEGAKALALWGELLERFGEHYEAGKRAREGLDFDDLELLAGALLARDAEVRRTWAERFELLMVDELQDVNRRQLELVRALERENLFTVGDEWQSIYSFRHADVSLFRAREQELAERGQSLRLAHNFRGRGELLEAVNAVFAMRFGEAFTPLRAGRESEREHEARGEPLIELLLTDRRGWGASRRGEESGVGAASAAQPWREAEARQLARRVAELVDGGRASPGEVAVLLRGTGDIECYERALRERGLETVASAGAFWERQEVADLLAYLRALEDPLDEVGLYGTLASPLAGLSAQALALVAQAARARGLSIGEAAREIASAVADAGVSGQLRLEEDAGEPLQNGERKRLARLVAWLERERTIAPRLALSELLERAVEHGDYAARLRLLRDGERRLANVRKLIELAEGWERSEGRDLRGFLDEAAFQQSTGGGFLAGAEAIAEPDAPAEGEARDAVRLMSVHAAKGLEFEVVCVADLGRAPSMGVPDLLVDGERVGLRLLGLDDPRSRPALEYDELAQERREAQAAEEDRIVYVAMTRARERLLLSGAVDFAAWPKERPGAAPIAWLGPALAPDLPALCREVAAGPTSERAAGERPGTSLKVDGTDVALALRLSTPGAGATP
ncbi:MAG TPA: UvrD-helicase domain-containing protein [Solirubrobacteraceae bacterium]|nr:UvrD-helicase domain-containing protein [Solirubrobacteraceae bacterium]